MTRHVLFLGEPDQIIRLVGTLSDRKAPVQPVRTDAEVAALLRANLVVEVR